MTCLELGPLATAAGVQPGVLNVVTGRGQAAGAALVRAPGIAKVSFTGSGPTGAAIATACAPLHRPFTAELGGKSALIVMADADIDKAVEWCMFGVFWTNGQICSSTSRLLVHESIADAFCARLKVGAAVLTDEHPRVPTAMTDIHLQTIDRHHDTPRHLLDT